MFQRHHRPTRDRQGGAALLIMLLLLVLGATVLFSRNLASRLPGASRAATNAQLLAEAKEALLGYATTWDGTHPGELGLLPCPDIDATGPLNEGEAHELLCGLQYQNVLGRFPWRTLGVDPGRTRGGECLWYAVSGAWKAGGPAKPGLVNEDSSGQFRVLAADGTTVIASTAAAERPVAVIIAPGPPVAGQVRLTLPTGVTHCGGNYLPANYLDDDAASGINNANLATAPDSVDDFIASDPGGAGLNDQVIFITRAELQDRLLRRPDVQAKLRNLTLAVAKCVADYGKRNPGAPDDRRLPWPAPLDLAEYRSAVQYDDTPVGALSGRLPNVVNDSNAQTGNPGPGLLTACDSATVPEWTPEMAILWRNWKDHLFYALAWDFRPSASPATTCTTCLRVNGAGAWTAVVMFSGTRLAAGSQVRDEPPMNTDTRGNVANYLEGRNATNHPNTAGNGDYESAAQSSTFNDILYCIDANLSVTAC